VKSASPLERLSSEDLDAIAHRLVLDRRRQRDARHLGSRDECGIGLIDRDT